MKPSKANRRLFGENGRRVADVLDSLAKVVWEQGRLAEAESLAKQAVDTEISADRRESFQNGVLPDVARRAAARAS